MGQPMCIKPVSLKQTNKQPKPGKLHQHIIYNNNAFERHPTVSSSNSRLKFLGIVTLFVTHKTLTRLKIRPKMR